MTKWQTALMLVLLVPGRLLLAQTLVSPALQDSTPPQKQEQQPQSLTIYPAAEPDPALRYRFWPAPQGHTDRDAMPFVSRAIVLALKQTQDPAARIEFHERYSEWNEMPVNELPVEEVRALVEKFGGAALSELARAENHMRIDYDLQLNELSAPEIIRTVLPEFQEMRQLARLLHLRARLAIAEQRWQDAVDDIRLGFRLAEIAGHSTEFLVGRLVGFAVSGLMMETVLEAIQQPTCPNLYWALACLPENRLSETRRSIEFESVMLSRLGSRWSPLPDHPVGAEAASERIRQLAGEAKEMFDFGEGSPDTESAMFLSGLYVVTMAEPSRQLLAETTAWGQKARDLSPSEAVLRATLLKLSRSRDRWVKWSFLPAEVWEEYEAERAASIAPSGTFDLVDSLANLLTPAVDAARRAGRRTEQMRNFLITIEALRMHASVTGSLPPTVDRLRPVPCWDDPLALAPFRYQRTSATRASLSRNQRWPRDPDTHFQIQLKKENR